MEVLKHLARTQAHTLVITKDLAERRSIMDKHADAFVALVGGTGTLDEMTDVFELKRHGMHGKPLIVLNTAGFYDRLIEQYRHMEREGFLKGLPEPLDQMIHIVETPEEVMEILDSVKGANPDAAELSTSGLASAADGAEEIDPLEVKLL
jgi:uncharacterized protein (TIGR00730 family)